MFNPLGLLRRPPKQLVESSFKVYQNFIFEKELLTKTIYYFYVYNLTAEK